MGFVDSPELLVIDEIQRVPELLLAIKTAVDEDPRPGRYLLTGSSRLSGVVAAPDALPGRMETIELWPFSQGEIDGEPDGFVDAIFALGPALRPESTVTRADDAARIIRGGLFVDSGIAANEVAVDARALLRPGAPFGPLLESFVLSELSRQLTWSEQQADLSHYRDTDVVAGSFCTPAPRRCRSVTSCVRSRSAPSSK